MLWDAPEDEQLKKEIDNILVANLTSHQDSQTFPDIFIDYIQYLEGPAVSRTVYHEVIAPDVILMIRSEPDAGAVIQP
jgi:hypothetical protein